jgi:hypothetical protein
METIVPEGVFDTQMIIIISLIMMIAIIFYVYYVTNHRHNVLSIEVSKTIQKIDLIMDYLQRKEDNSKHPSVKPVTVENLRTQQTTTVEQPQTQMVDSKVPTPKSSIYNYITHVKMSSPDDRQSAYDDVQTVEPDDVEFISNTPVTIDEEAK